MALTDKLTNIANAIREKGGTTEKLTLDAMPTAISALSTGGGGIPDEAFVISGDCSYWDYQGKWDKFITTYANKWSTSNITDAVSMFNYSKLETIPFELNFDNTTTCSCNNLFYACIELKEIGKIVNMCPDNINYMFYACNRLRYLPQFENINLTQFQAQSYSSGISVFKECYSLHSIPEDLLKQLYQPKITSIYRSFFHDNFRDCYALDEIKGLNPQTGTITSNLFSGSFNYCGRVKNIIFAVQEDGAPYIVNWRNQVINLTSLLGYLSRRGDILNYNSGITADKEVVDDATYQALKGNPDWFSCNIAYSRYNHDSAVATINTLPDTSAYLASGGGTNTIKFKGESGSATDGGAINTLTEAEIAVATAKGWSVVYV